MLIKAPEWIVPQPGIKPRTVSGIDETLPQDQIIFLLKLALRQSWQSWQGVKNKEIEGTTIDVVKMEIMTLDLEEQMDIDQLKTICQKPQEAGRAWQSLAVNRPILIWLLKEGKMQWPTRKLFSRL